MPVLVTGATSQIGRRVVARLSNTGAPASVLGRRRIPAFEDGSVTFHAGDLAQPKLELPGPVTALIHIAAIWLLPQHIEMMHRQGLRRLVCFGSTAIYSKPDSVNAGEREVARRMIEAEESIARQCDSLDIGWTVLRPTLVYGLGLDRNISRAARLIQRTGFYPISTGATGLRQPVHADDLAGAALAVLESDMAAGKRYDVGGGERLPYREMIGRIFDALGRPRRFVPLPGLEYAAAAAGIVLRRPEVTGDVVRRMRLDLICDNDAAHADLGYQPRNFLEGGRADLPR